MNAWSTALPDWEDRIMAGKSLVPDLPLFRDQAEKALRIFKRLRIPDLHGKPTMAEACGPWFFPIVEALFGSYDCETHRRMIQEYFLLIPKKNAKSSSAGPLMLTALIMNQRPEAEFLLIAPTIEIAKIAFKQAANTIKADAEVAKIFKIQDHVRTITHLNTGATLMIKAADTDVITGGKALGTLIDETHVFSKKANAADIFLELRGALASRPDGFLFQITTQSKDAPAGVFKSELQSARDVRDGAIDLPLLAILYEHPEHLIETDLWQEPEYWSVVNPNLGRSVDEAFIERNLRKAQRGGVEDLKLFASQHFNLEIGLRLGNDAWAGGRHWEGAGDETLTLDSLLERSEVVTIGIDAGGLDDLFGLTVLGREKKTREWLLWGRAWAQDDVFKHRPEIASRLRDFADAGELVACETPTQDVLEVVDIVERIWRAGLLPAKNGIGLDPQGVSALLDEIADRGIEDERVIGIPQGYKLSSAVWGMERKLKDGTLWHGNQALMAWCVGNAKAEQRGNAVLVTKQQAGKAKIDPLCAAFNAVILMNKNPEAAGLFRSPWEDPDFQMAA